MIITRTPYRCSLYGGSTDFESFCTKHGSLLLGFTIDKYCYVSVKPYHSFGNSHYEAYYSTVEKVKNIDEIKNPGIRGSLIYLKRIIPELKDIAIHVQNELPSQSGISSSSCLIVGLLKAVLTLYNIPHTKRSLTLAAIEIERDILNEPGGLQDQVWAAYGGFNSISISSRNNILVKPLPLDEEFLDLFRRSSILFYTNSQRDSFHIASSHDTGVTKEKIEIFDLAHCALYDFNKQNIPQLVYDLKESWAAKTCISNKISNDNINNIIKKIEDCGGGAKLMGSGGGGFIYALMSDLNKRELAIREVGLPILEFDFSFSGSEVIYKE